MAAIADHDAPQDTIPVVERDGFYVTTEQLANLDGKPIPGDIVSGPHASREEARAHCGDGQRVWRFESL